MNAMEIIKLLVAVALKMGMQIISCVAVLLLIHEAISQILGSKKWAIKLIHNILENK